MKNRNGLTLFVILLCVLAGCAGSGRVVPSRPEARLEPEQAVELGSPAANICRDGDGLLVLDISGARILRFDSTLATTDTIPLTERMVAPLDVAADRFYIYVADDHALYRMSKEKSVLQAWLGNVRVAGLAGFDPGAMLVSDAKRGAIWYKGLFGESRQFIGGADIPRPGAMAALPGGTFAVISAGAKLVLFNRSAITLRSVPIASGCDLLASDEQGTLFLGQSGVPVVWVLKGNRLDSYQLSDSASPLAIIVVGNRLAVLDAGTRISSFRVPGDQ